MTRRMRLSLTGFLLFVSAVYAALVIKDPDVAYTIMLWYIGMVLTIFAVTELWKKP